MLKVAFLSLFLISTGVAMTPEFLARRIQAHLLIGDSASACLAAQAALKSFPQDPLILEWVIRSLASEGELDRFMETWELLHAMHPEKALNQNLLEEMSWGILRKGQTAPGFTTQLISLIGAALTQDMRAVSFLIEGMHHTHVQIRALAVELSAYYKDQALKEEIGRLFQEEQSLDVRVEVIKALGVLKLDTYLPDLMRCLENRKINSKEKEAAIQAIILLREKIGEDELKVLAGSKRAGLRQLACEAIGKCQQKNASHLLIQLIQDSQPEVAASALKAWGLLRQPATDTIKQLAKAGLDPRVAITAAWVWLLEDPKEAATSMLYWLEHKEEAIRSLAASAVASAGPYGLALAKEQIEKSSDPFVRLNLALGLARQREETLLACQVLEEVLENNRELWMISTDGLFETIEKSNLRHNSAIPNYPEVINQTVRLEIINLLAILESPRALSILKAFLKEKKWGVTGLAAESLLGEGDETAIDLVRELLRDEDPSIRLEAALVLASWARDLSATQTLLDVYSKVDRQTKLKILESLGRIGDKTVIPFLLERFKEPSLIIRMVAASMLIVTLNQ
jgi:HEAT repeat protein